MAKYEVEDVIGLAYVKDLPYHKVKWKGYPFEECTWEDEKSLNLKAHLLQNYSFKKTPLSLFTKTVKFDTLDELYEYDRQLQLQIQPEQLHQRQGEVQNFSKPTQCQDKSAQCQYKSAQCQYIQAKSTSANRQTKKRKLGRETIKKRASSRSRSRSRSKEKGQIKFVQLNELPETSIQECLDLPNEVVEMNTDRQFNDGLVQILNIFPVFQPTKLKLQVMARIRRISLVDGKSVEKLIRVEELKSNGENLRIAVEYFLKNLLMRGTPVIIDEVDNLSADYFNLSD